MSQSTQVAPSLEAQLADYLCRWPEESGVVQAFVELLEDTLDPFRRERLAGHFTSGAWLVSADGVRILMTHHRKLGRWLQLGGHADGERDMGQVALKEAQEESGLTGLAVEGEAIFDLDRHWIPERKEVPGHWHYDVRYVVRAGEDENYVVSEESLDLAWRSIAEVALDADESMSRMARKWLGFLLPSGEGARRADEGKK
ncbi:MAG: NUDIX hydrolase [Lysobacteraceae bacterium]|nr:MAG: NUDIX hydrolase [Xanthomonadaceae bacterium]